MKNNNKTIMIKLGWLGMIASSVILLIQKRVGVDEFDVPALFFFNYAITLAFFLGMIFTKMNKKDGKWWNIPASVYSISLVLFMMSAFSLNFSVAIFSDMVPWAEKAVGMVIITILALPYTHSFSKPLKNVVLIAAGGSTIFLLYLCIYLLPYYHIFLIGGIVLGLGFHGLSPLLMIIFLFKQLSKLLNTTNSKMAYSMGIVIPFVFFTYFFVQWNKFDQLIHRVHAEQILTESNDFPNWVILSQNLPINKFTEKILMGEYVFDNFNLFEWGRGFGMNPFNERSHHDPFIALALVLGKKHSISVDDRVKVLSAVFDGRHFAHRKLWSGDKLITKDIITNVKLYPDYRIAYVEKTLTIQNTNTWNRQQEALYTFYLPEGSVASSLSLWVNGVEEKSRLTTKSKADSAYVSIVRVERRDPALLHWQEGNAVNVTVFPCTPQEDRVFKIGFTVPLELKNNKLVFTNPSFKGHEFKGMRETAQVQVDGDKWPEDITLPGHLTYSKSVYKSTGKYKPNWKITFAPENLNTNKFSFINHSYQLKPLEKEFSTFQPTAIYLDINTNWNLDDLKSLAEVETPIYIFDKNKRIKVDQLDKNFLNDFNNLQFSLFPFHLIPDPETSIVITKSDNLGPNLEEISKYEFAKKVKERFKNKKDKFYLFSIGSLKSPYLKTLNEVGLFHLEEGNSKELSEIVAQHKFPIVVLQENEVVIQHSGIVIQQNIDSTNYESNAPDHLLRLHHYNQLMQTLGTNYFDKQSHEESLIALANEAFITTPISSLVVLETIKDYERFGIEENKNSLKNASMNNSGAVPEPAEWLLIILTLVALGGLTYRKLLTAAH
ncbi:MAG: XrtN system VIT domain-containing protein [Chitinophagales bacterium]